MSDHRRIDDALRSTPVPEGLQSRLRPEALFADNEIDRLLAKVPVPPGLADRIRNAIVEQPNRHRDGAIDLSRFGTSSRIDKIPLARPTVLAPRHRSGLVSLARDITSVAVALGLVFVITVAGIEFSRQLEGTGPADKTITRLDFSENMDDPSLEWPMRFHIPDGAWAKPVDPTAPKTAPPADQATAPNRVPPSERGPSSPVPPESIARDEQRMMAIVRGAPVSAVPLPGMLGPPRMATVDIPTAARRTVPRVRGYDLAFEMTTGEQPFVDPAAHPSLALDRPPLTLRTDGFEALTAMDRSLRGRIRAEEVLAAMQPPPARRLKGQPVAVGIHEVRGLRSVGGTRTVLVEVAATVDPIQRGGRPIEATLVLDQAAAGNPAVWRRICRAMGELARHLAADDRISVVVCGPRPRVAVESADAVRLAALATDLEWQSSAASSDLDAGLLLTRPGSRIIVVAHAVSLEAAGGAVRESLSAWHNALSIAGGDTLACDPVGGTRFVIFDPTAPSSSERGEPSFGRTSTDVVSIRRALVQQATGRATLVASQCEFEVRFDPRRVARYRLIGHRQSAVESLADAPSLGTDLHAGETVRVVYEVIPRTPDIHHGLASAAVSWRSLAGDRPRLDVAPNRSSTDVSDGLPSPRGCELLLAAGLGEFASGSSHVGPRPAFAAALEQLVAEWQRRGDMTPLGEALARSLNHRRSGGRNGQ